MIGENIKTIKNYHLSFDIKKSKQMYIQMKNQLFGEQLKAFPTETIHLI